MQTKEMIATRPDVHGNVNQALIDAIDAAYTCAQTCTSCADACLADHYLPLLYVIGTRQASDSISFPVEGVDGGSISMLSVRVGEVKK